MNADDKDKGWFYCNFKVHKEHNNIPPPRPITSCSGSITENIGTFIEYHIKKIATTHEAYIEDTQDFLRVIDKINKGPKHHPKTMLVTSYIRHEDFLRPSFVRPSSVLLRNACTTPLISELGWTGELWSKTKFLILEN